MKIYTINNLILNDKKEKKFLDNFLKSLKEKGVLLITKVTINKECQEIFEKFLSKIPFEIIILGDHFPNCIFLKENDYKIVNGILFRWNLLNDFDVPETNFVFSITDKTKKEIKKLDLNCDILFCTSYSEYFCYKKKCFSTFPLFGGSKAGYLSIKTSNLTPEFIEIPKNLESDGSLLQKYKSEINIEKNILPPLYFSFVKFKKYNLFKNQKFEFSPGLNLIKGRNCSGKSTILNSVLMKNSNVETNFEKVIPKELHNLIFLKDLLQMTPTEISDFFNYIFDTNYYKEILKKVKKDILTCEKEISFHEGKNNNVEIFPLKEKSENILKIVEILKKNSEKNKRFYNSIKEEIKDKKPVTNQKIFKGIKLTDEFDEKEISNYKKPIRDFLLKIYNSKNTINKELYLKKLATLEKLEKNLTVENHLNDFQNYSCNNVTENDSQKLENLKKELKDLKDLKKKLISKELEKKETESHFKEISKFVTDFVKLVTGDNYVLEISSNFSIKIKKDKVSYNSSGLSNFENLLINCGVRCFLLEKLGNFDCSLLIDEKFDCVSIENRAMMNSLIVIILNYYKNILLVSHLELENFKLDYNLISLTKSQYKLGDLV